MRRQIPDVARRILLTAVTRTADTARNLANSAVDCRRRADTAVDRNSVPNTVRPRFAEIIDLTEKVCRTHLTEEYATIIGELTATLARKRPSPLLRGHSRTWACGITYTVGSVNFLFHPAKQPYNCGADLCACFGVSQSAGAAKSREITRLFDIAPIDSAGRFRADSPRIRWCGCFRSAG
jgi:hypothetical protein